MSRKAAYLALYETIAEVSSQMLRAARGADWTAVNGLQAEYLSLVDGLKAAEEGVQLDQAERGHKYILIRRILADDAAIRDLASPEVARMSALFDAGRSTRMLKDIYRARR